MSAYQLHRIAPKKGLASAALRAQRFWDAGVTEWDGDEFKKSQNSMNSLFGALQSRRSLYIAEEDTHDDATYSNMMEEEMAMADLGFDQGWGFEDDFTPAVQEYRPFVKPIQEDVKPIERKASNDSLETGSTTSTSKSS